MREAGHDSPDVLIHSQEAFNTAGTLALLIGLLIAATGAIIVSVLISRRLHRSLDDLGEVAARISDGDYAPRVGQPDSRELAALADSFNTMAARLDAIEGSRRRLLTDLAHEIRTPLASMEICVESLEDGAIEPGPEAWQILSSQIERISRLADDLGQVSAAEEGRLDLTRRPPTPTCSPTRRSSPRGTASSASTCRWTSVRAPPATCWWTPIRRGSSRCWATCSRTRSGTPPPADRGRGRCRGRCSGSASRCQRRRRRHRHRAPAAHLRPLLPRGHRARPGPRRHRGRAGDQPRDREGPRRTAHRRQ